MFALRVSEYVLPPRGGYLIHELSPPMPSPSRTTPITSRSTAITEPSPSALPKPNESTVLRGGDDCRRLWRVPFAKRVEPGQRDGMTILMATHEMGSPASLSFSLRSSTR